SMADMHVFETGDRLVVMLEGAVAADVAGRWAKFVFSEDVQVRDVSAETGQLGIYGPAAAAVLAAALASEPGGPSREDLASMPMHANRTLEFRGTAITIIRPDDLGLDGFDVVMAAPLLRDRGDLLRKDDRDVGQITSRAASPVRGAVAIGYVQRDFAEPGMALSIVHDGESHAARVVQLPVADDRPAA